MRRPRRLTIASRAAIIVGFALLTLAFVLALRAVLVSTGAGSRVAPAAAAGASAPMRLLSTGAVASPAMKPVTAPTTGPAAGPDSLNTASGSAVVHVTEVVNRPGVVTLPPGNRVTGATNVIEGASAEIDTQQLSLARVLIDGEQTRVPHIGEVPPDLAPQTGGDATSDARITLGKPGGGGASGMVNINTVSASGLEKLPGIGPTLVQRVIEHRDSRGPSTSVNAPTDVPGTDKAELEGLREQTTI